MTDPNIEALAQVSSHLLDQLAEMRTNAGIKPAEPAEPAEPTYEDYYPKDSA